MGDGPADQVAGRQGEREGCAVERGRQDRSQSHALPSAGQKAHAERWISLPLAAPSAQVALEPRAQPVLDLIRDAPPYRQRARSWTHVKVKEMRRPHKTRGIGKILETSF